MTAVRRIPVPLLFLLAATAVLYLWDLGASGYANSFYAAAVQAGTHSWKAMLFGSLDPHNFITVDKPPASLWVMELSGRLFGFSPWSMLVPQALEGVATVGLLYATVRRWAGPTAALLAAAILALTPVATLMFRYNNPDALLTLLLVAAGYAMVRAVEHGEVRWLVLAGTCVGVGFLTKMLQAFLVLPAFALVYLVAAPVPFRRRRVHLLAGLGAVLVSAGWWVALVELWPAGSRPYVGGSTDDSVLELTFGYNGLGRLFGSDQPGGVGGPRGLPGGDFGGATGITRMFGDAFGAQIGWLVPAALIALAAALWLTRRAPRTDRTRAALMLWGGWLLVTGLVFSYMRGIVHPYYTIVLGPPIGALIATAGTVFWARRHTITARATVAAMTAVTGVWSYALLDRAPTWHPELKYAVLVLGAAGAAALLLHRFLPAALAVALLACGTASVGYSLNTVATVHSGAIPMAGPVGRAGLPNDTFHAVLTGRRTADANPEPTFDPALVSLIRAASTEWAAAVTGGQRAATLELATGRAVMEVGGYAGDDPTPTLEQFQGYVAAGRVRYFIGGRSHGAITMGATASDDINAWVAAHFAARTVGGRTVYDLTKGASPRNGKAPSS